MTASKIDKTIQKYHMLNSGDFVAVAVSGGADSMCLLSYLLAVREKLNLKLTVLNVEHGIRGQASIDDTEFVKQFCLDNHVDFKGVSIDAVNEAKAAGLGVEEYSRQKRYEFFDSVNADKIATAHNATDNLETVLFRLARGTGIKGCCGIPAVRGNIIRPLIECTSQEIRDYCRDNAIPFAVDETNSDNHYSRNFIRNEVIPLLRELNPALEKAGTRFINSAAETEEYMNQQAQSCFKECHLNGCLQLNKLKQYHPAVIKRVIQLFIGEYDITLDELHLQGIADLIHSPGKYQIKGKLFAISDKATLRLAVFTEPLDFNSVRAAKKILSYREFLTNSELLKKEFAFYCDYDKIIGNVAFRARREGDSIQPSGRGVTKSLKKLYNELKIPIEDRDDIPVITDDNGVIGIYGCCIDERVKIDNNTTNVMLIHIITEDNH